MKTTSSKHTNQEKTTPLSMLRTIVYVGFGCVIAWSVIYPFWTSSDAPVGSVSTDNKDSAASVDNISNQANDKIANSNSSSFLDIFAMPHGAVTEDILTAVRISSVTAPCGIAKISKKLLLLELAILSLAWLEILSTLAALSLLSVLTEPTGASDDVQKG